MIALLILCVVACLTSGSSEAVGCKDPSSNVGKWVGEKKAESLIHEKCEGLKGKSTSEWKKGENVKGACDSIPKWSAVAIFSDDEAIRENSAAIFESCEDGGIWVYQQTNDSPLQRQLFKYGSDEPAVNGDDLHVIML